MSETWFARPILFVADLDRTLDFYVTRLGFTQSWRFEEGGQAFVAQAERQGCALIFSTQWPDKVGKGVMFISLGDDAAVDQLRAELEGKGAPVEDGWWGYPLLVVRDPDGNELFFNYTEPRVPAGSGSRAPLLACPPSGIGIGRHALDLWWN